jgi:hypothetical protein
MFSQELIRLCGQRLAGHSGQGRASVNARLNCFLLGCARQLPTPQCKGKSDRQQGSQCNQAEPEARVHRIIPSMKYLILLAFIGILGSLATALILMLKNKGDEKSRGRKMASALALRVGISIILFSGILLAWKFGYIQPTGIAAGR